MTLEQIIERERAHRVEGGDFGIEACKSNIIWHKKFFEEDYFQQLKKYVERANTDIYFNKAMVLACWELINEK